MFPDLHDARPGDGLVVIFDCEPRIVLTHMERVGLTGRIRLAMKLMSSQGWNDAAAVSQVGVGLDAITDSYALLEGAAAAEVAQALEVHWLNVNVADKFGHSSAVAARLLLDTDRRCTGCDRELDLTDAGASNDIEIRTVDALKFRKAHDEAVAPIESDDNDLDYLLEQRRPPTVPVDWPAVLCRECRNHMSDNGFRNFLDYRFSYHPACPQCGGRQTQRALFGMPMFETIVPPWRHTRGCCVTEENWTCTLCTHRW